VTALPRLFAPLLLGTVELRNRIVSTAHQTTLVHDHLPTDDFVAYHRARAEGGVGLIVLEATAVHPSGLLTAHTLGGFLPELELGYRRVADAVQPAGTRVFVQLFHGGREQISTPPRAPALAPSAVPSPRFRVEPRALSPREIEEMVGGYARAAEIAAAAGLDGVEVSAAHRYLVEQFYDPAVNRRSDGWRDGSRFLHAVLASIRAAAPGLCLGVRLSADSRQLPALLQTAHEAGVDYVSLALGDSSTYLGSVGIVPPPPLANDLIGSRPAIAAPVIVTSRVVDAAAADRLIAESIADAVGMTRALIADPALPAKASAGRTDEVIRCIGCNVCIAHYHAGTPIACAVNPRTGREASFAVPPSPRRHRIVIVGAGPAGLAAATEAANAGLDVVLLERADRVGGQMALAGSAPGNAEVARSFVSTALKRLGRVELRLGSEASLESVLALDPDAVVVATGADPYVDERLDLDSVETRHAWDVLAGNVPSGRSVVVADWGGDPGGLDAAELLASAGNTVTLVVESVAIGEAVHQYRRNLYLQRLYRAEVELVHHLAIGSAADGRVTFRNVFAPERQATLTADLLVLAHGRVPHDDLSAPLIEAGARVETAGDCCSPRSLEEAVLEGTLAAHRAMA
jgi:2,4-dienoyl-CoA reductase-like NADH-dependent reductase (Old Yellow Enzyme family)/thioredoxin reductase